jgi:DNA-directed RNA polymerase specialized sigma24 family protein
MMKAWIAWDTVVVPPEHSVYSAQRAWLSRILANVFISKYRRQRQHDAALTTHLAAVVDGVCPNAEVAPTRVGVEPTYSQAPPATLDLTGDEVLAAVSSLPANQREVVQRYYFDNEPMPDIAEAMGNSLSCTHKLAFRARISLARSLGRYARENYRMELPRVDAPTLEPAASPEPDADRVDAVMARFNNGELRVG